MQSNAFKPRTKKSTNVGGRPARAGKAATSRIATRLTKQEHDALLKAAHNASTAPGVLARIWILKELHKLGLLVVVLASTACAADATGAELADVDAGMDGMSFAGSSAPTAGGMAPAIESDAGAKAVEADAGATVVDPVAAGSGGTGGGVAGSPVAVAGTGGSSSAAGKGGAGGMLAAGSGGTAGTVAAAGAGGSAGGAAGAGGSPAAATTMCKLNAGQTHAGQVVFCGGFWQQYFSDWMLSWPVMVGAAQATGNCNQAVQCVKGARCEFSKIGGSSPTEIGVCQ